jgi:hypothetical protein
MAKLNNEQKLFIVQELACFRTPSQVVQAVYDEFEELVVERQQVQFYDPTKRPENKKLPEKWKDIFWETRKQYIEDTAAVAVSHKRYRLEVIQGVLNRLQEAKLKNNKAILEATEQGAKEVGGLYTNKREHSGPNGGAIPLDVGDKSRKLAGQMLKKLMDKGMKEDEARASLISMGVNERDIPAISNS